MIATALPPRRASIASALAGIDFTSRPTRRKPITVALGHMTHGAHGAVRLDRIDLHTDFAGFAAWLHAPGSWLGVFDLPFGLPRELVLALGWPTEWAALMRHYAALSRTDIRGAFAAFCNARPVGAKFAHRATDGPAGSSPSMKWVNPPVAYMLHAGVPLLIDAGVHVPGLHAGDTRRIALEGYPGLLAREVLGTRPYKSDEPAKQTPERLIARIDLVDALDQGRTRLGLRLKLGHAQREALIADASGDKLDAALCLMQAAWASGQPNHGLPADMDALEGWIVTAGHAVEPGVPPSLAVRAAAGKPLPTDRLGACASKAPPRAQPAPASGRRSKDRPSNSTSSGGSSASAPASGSRGKDQPRKVSRRGIPTP